jgi:dTDP-L-rhamnose 4-epimerase
MARVLHGATRGQAPAPQVTGTWRAGDVRHVFASTARIAREFGYRPSVSFEAGIADFAFADLR